MFKGIISNVSVTENTNIPIFPVIDSNRSVTYNSSNNTITFNSPGYYDVIADIVITNATPGNITLIEMVNNIPSPNAKSSNAVVATTNYMTLSIADVIHVIPDMFSTNANISFQLDVPATVVNGTILIEARK